MSYTHLTPSEREELALMYRAHHSMHFMANDLGRSVSTISRELKRNVNARENYKAVNAQLRYLDQRKKCVKPHKLKQNKAWVAFWDYRLGRGLGMGRYQAGTNGKGRSVFRHH